MHTHVDNKIERKSVYRSVYRQAKKRKKRRGKKKRRRREILGYIFHIAFDQKVKKKGGGGKYMTRSLAPPFCTPVNTRTYYLQDLLLTMVIFVLLIWLWVWCNAVAGYFVPSFPSSFRPLLLSRYTRRYFFTAKREHDEVARRMARSPSHFRLISDDDFRSNQ